MSEQTMRPQVLLDEIAQLRAENERLRGERDQFAEQAALRDSRDADMQEIMRLNNALRAENERLRGLLQRWLLVADDPLRETLVYLQTQRELGETFPTESQRRMLDAAPGPRWPAQE